MPCLFIRNASHIGFESNLISKLYNELAEAIFGSVEDFEIHVENTAYHLLLSNGEVGIAPNVHVFVEYHGRGLMTKTRIAQAIQRFFNAHAHGKDLDITFRDSPSETFFFNGDWVPGGKPRDN